MKSLAASYHRFIGWQQQIREPSLTALLIIEGVLLFVATPLAGMGWMPGFLLSAMFMLFAVVALIVTSRSHFAFAVALFAVIMSPIGSLIHAYHPSVGTVWISACARMLAIVAISLVIARAVFGSGRVTWHRVQGAVVLYMNFALFFFTAFRLIEDLVPNAFTGLPQSGSEHGSGAALLYFSFNTLTTAGFGDISPVYPIARNVANLEAVIGQLFPPTLLARLVTLELEHRRQSKSE